jgi:dihydroflavonol-4-reductase
MKTIVTGANGLIGTHLIRTLLAGGHTVRAFVRPTSDLRTLDGLDVEFAYGDVFEPDSFRAAAAGCEVLFHAAAVYAYTGYSAEQLLHVAVDGTRIILRAAKEAGIARVVLTSSSVAVGSSLRPEVRNESHELRDVNPPAYITAKAEQERDAFAIARSLGLDLVAVQPTLTVGRYDPRIGPSNGLICSYLRDPWHITWGGGCNIVAVEDVAMGHVLAAERGVAGGRYLLGAENLTWPEVHGLISDIAGVAGPTFRVNHTTAFLAACAEELVARVGGTTPLTSRVQASMVGRYYWYEHSAAARTLGYRPMSSRAALHRTIAWLAGSAHLPPWVRAQLKVAPLPSQPDAAAEVAA